MYWFMVTSLSNFTPRINSFSFWWIIPFILIQCVWICPFCNLGNCRSIFLKKSSFLSLNIVFILTNSADPDEMRDFSCVAPMSAHVQVSRLKRGSKFYIQVTFNSECRTVYMYSILSLLLVINKTMRSTVLASYGWLSWPFVFITPAWFSW